jgi:hypothetical protein
LRNHYHALRPLRIVLDTACEPWRRQFAALLANVRCELIDDVDINGTSLGTTADSSNRVKSAGALPHDPALETRRAAQHPPALPCSALAAQVVAAEAHFGLCVSDDGQSLTLVDERGSAVETSLLARALAAAAGSTICVDSNSSPESAYLAIRAASAGVGASAGPRVWFADRDPPVADSLAAVTALLVLLSQSDRRVSEVLAENV